MTIASHTRWVSEFLRDGETRFLAVREWLHSARSEYQEMDIVYLEAYGKSLFLDGKLQSSERDEFIYHEALVHPALVSHPAPRRVCIIGGGEGATLREVLRHQTVHEAVMIDIDRLVVEACQRWLPEWSQGAFQDPRTRLVIADARGYLEEHSERFDAMVIDVTDPLVGGPSYRLFTAEFYETVRQRLTDQGVLVVQAEDAAHGDCAAFVAICRTLAAVFPVVRPYVVTIPSFAAPWGFALATVENDPLSLTAAEVDRRLAERGVSPTRFYDGTTHSGLFALPLYLRQAIAAETTVIRDEAPIFVR